MYVMRVKDSAITTNPAVAELVEEEGTCLTLDSEREAEDLVKEYSQNGGRVRIQKVAPQDSDNVNAYLISYPRRHLSQPKNRDNGALTFDVGANLYGEIGRAVVCGSYGLSPGVKYYFEEMVQNYVPDDHYLRVIEEPYFPDEVPNNVGWSPDCLIIIRRDYETIEGLYFCEIKSGNSSFERSQQEGMKTVAKYHNALKIRVGIDDLPAEYTLRISEISAED